MPYKPEDFQKTEQVDKLADEYRNFRPESQKLHERALEHFGALGATHMGRIFDPFLPYITHAKGSRKWDVDGREYIDYFMGHGALILGHSHPEIVRAVQDQVARGVHFSSNHALEVEWAELIKDLVPMAEKIEFCACGQEANMMAVRLARIFTGRRKILRFHEHYHGWADELAQPGAGIETEDVMLIPHDPEALEAQLATGKYAALFTEGGGGHMGGMIPIDPEFVRTIPELARKYGTIWVLDEVVTGFRDAPGGYQEMIGVRPDLTILGKCVAGGMPAGAVAGRRDILELFNPVTAKERWVMHGGTWNATPLAAAAGIAALKLYKDGEPQRMANEIAAYLRKQANALFKEKGVNARLYGRSIGHLYLGENDYDPDDDTMVPVKTAQKIIDQENAMRSVRTRLSLHLQHRGIATALGRMFIHSAAHNREDIDQTVAALSDSIDAMIAEDTLGAVYPG
jgi:glutamate-1-semialdehyde 2,1-aminomutase